MSFACTNATPQYFGARTTALSGRKVNSMPEPKLRELVQAQGYVFLRDMALPEATAIAQSLGEITADRRSPDPHRPISPQAIDAAKPNTLSSRYGLANFPFHTDVAHWKRPADFVLLYCENPGSGDRPTELIDARQWRVSDHLGHSLRSSLWKTGYLSPAFCTVVDYVDGLANWRYDVGCMRPAGNKSAQLQLEIEVLISSSKPLTVSWSKQALLVIDNKRMLHARGRAAMPDQDRKLIRMLVGGMQ